MGNSMTKTIRFLHSAITEETEDVSICIQDDQPTRSTSTLNPNHLRHLGRLLSLRFSKARITVQQKKGEAEHDD